LSDLLVEDCTHVKALLILIEELDSVFNIVPDQFLHPSVDDHNYSTPLKVVKLCGASNLVCVMEPNPAVVLCECGFSCLGCNRGRDSCDHVKYLNFLKNNIQESPDDVADLVLTSSEPVPTQHLLSAANKSVIQPVSQLPISFELTTTLQQVLINSPENVLPVCPISAALLLVPCLPHTSSNGFQERCPKCQSDWNTEDPLNNGWKDTSI